MVVVGKRGANEIKKDHIKLFQFRHFSPDLLDCHLQRGGGERISFACAHDNMLEAEFIEQTVSEEDQTRYGLLAVDLIRHYENLVAIDSIDLRPEVRRLKDDLEMTTLTLYDKSSIFLPFTPQRRYFIADLAAFLAQFQANASTITHKRNRYGHTMVYLLIIKWQTPSVFLIAHTVATLLVDHLYQERQLQLAVIPPALSLQLQLVLDMARQLDEQERKRYRETTMQLAAKIDLRYMSLRDIVDCLTYLLSRHPIEETRLISVTVNEQTTLYVARLLRLRNNIYTTAEIARKFLMLRDNSQSLLADEDENLSLEQRADRVYHVTQLTLFGYLQRGQMIYTHNVGTMNLLPLPVARLPVEKLTQVLVKFIQSAYLQFERDPDAEVAIRPELVIELSSQGKVAGRLAGERRLAQAIEEIRLSMQDDEKSVRRRLVDLFMLLFLNMPTTYHKRAQWALLIVRQYVITLHSLERILTFYKSGWLDDAVVNSYAFLLDRAQRLRLDTTQRSYVFDSAHVTRIFQYYGNKIRGASLESASREMSRLMGAMQGYSVFHLPINTGGDHWVLLVWYSGVNDRDVPRLHFYDSQADPMRADELRAIIRFFREANDGRDQWMDPEPVNIFDREIQPRGNDFDCGVYLCLVMALTLTSGRPGTYMRLLSQLNAKDSSALINEMRQEIFLTLLLREHEARRVESIFAPYMPIEIEMDEPTGDEDGDDDDGGGERSVDLMDL